MNLLTNPRLTQLTHEVASACLDEWLPHYCKPSDELDEPANDTGFDPLGAA